MRMFVLIYSRFNWPPLILAAHPSYYILVNYNMIDVNICTLYCAPHGEIQKFGG